MVSSNYSWYYFLNFVLVNIFDNAKINILFKIKAQNVYFLLTAKNILLVDSSSFLHQIFKERKKAFSPFIFPLIIPYLTILFFKERKKVQKILLNFTIKVIKTNI